MEVEVSVRALEYNTTNTAQSSCVAQPSCELDIPATGVSVVGPRPHLIIRCVITLITLIILITLYDMITLCNNPLIFLL